MTTPPKQIGTSYERRVADYAAGKPWLLPWDRAPLRGTADLLDISGSLPDGWLVGCKAITRRGNLADRLSGAMEQNRAAMANLERMYPGRASGVVPVQIVQRQGYPVGRSYAVMEFDQFLSVVLMRREWNAILEAG